MRYEKLFANRELFQRWVKDHSITLDPLKGIWKRGVRIGYYSKTANGSITISIYHEAD